MMGGWPVGTEHLQAVMARDAGRAETRRTQHSGMPARYHQRTNVVLTGKQASMPHLDGQAVPETQHVGAKPASPVEHVSK